VRTYRTRSADRRVGGIPKRTFNTNRGAALRFLASPATTLSLGVLAMLHWALIFLVVALIAAAFGFGGIAGAATGIAKILFFGFLVLFLVSLVVGGLYKPAP